MLNIYLCLIKVNYSFRSSLNMLKVYMLSPLNVIFWINLYNNWISHLMNIIFRLRNSNVSVSILHFMLLVLLLFYLFYYQSHIQRYQFMFFVFWLPTSIIEIIIIIYIWIWILNVKRPTFCGFIGSYKLCRTKNKQIICCKL